MSFRKFGPIGLVLLFLIGSVAEPGEQPGKNAKDSGKFMRLSRDAMGEPVAMETAIVRYISRDCGKDAPTVDLIGAVHVADKSYYQQLNKDFEKYDVLLYELVAPEGTVVPKGGGESQSTLASFQKGMKNVLELEFQLDQIDYTKKNFVHADMSPDDFVKSMNKRGESVWTMMFRIMGNAMAQQSKNPTKSSDLELLMALFNKNRALMLKRAMAEQFEDLEGAMGAFNGPDGSTIITERNKVVMAALTKQLAAGKKRIGIFYGAGHLPDMEKRLDADFGLGRIEERWLVAWNLRAKAKPPNAAPAQKK
ncbi:MAG: TraB/GumN family protein [Pirellulales bacterium]